MSISSSLQTQITALQSRINAVLPTATPEEITLLAKGIEAISGQVSAMDLRAYTDTLGAELTVTATNASTAVNNTVSTATSNIATAQAAAITAVNANGFSRAEFHSAALLF